MGWDERTQRDLPRLKAMLHTRHYARRSASICSFDIHSCPEQFGNIIPLFQLRKWRLRRDRGSCSRPHSSSVAEVELEFPAFHTDSQCYIRMVF